MSAGELILYRSEDGRAEIQLRADGETVWLTQAEMAELFDTTPQAITQHIRAIYGEGELSAEATCKDSLQVRQEGQRQVRRRLKAYSLPMILAVGYRVRSPRGTQFRQWATAHLEEYLVKGFVMDDERLKEPGGWDYFDELLARIRDIRASEKRFYQKVRDLFALSSDYRPDDRDAQTFFAEVQNKLLYAVTGHTAAEIVVQRADADSPNMALTSWKGARVRKQDVTIAKNYLSADEVDTLNRLVVIFLEQAELRAKERKDLTLDYWRHNVDRLLEFNERPILDGAGAISAERAREIAHERYERFDAQRRRDEALEADAEDLRELEALEKRIKKEDKS
ncbi:virulence RhuM family protein [Wenzhouxiangella sp. AB-CW3]|uniref:virulence RhuM family protein n=1 Tax=Wenzhouxiangella sp. AB-CW3 TaxID=2771012 RepID=UPI00168AE58F|nr:virulence RhuM family protein [Wenzhouxiangella sp. AB-CW3]QOC24086.1 virulence RhuM family protein [Wenzhouxiangella sp. AB-CW3]